MQMEMGMGGAMNGITNSILTNDDNLSICGLSFMKRTSQYASVLLVNHPANDSPNSEGVLYRTISHGLVDFNGQNFHSIDLLLL